MRRGILIILLSLVILVSLIVRRMRSIMIALIIPTTAQTLTQLPQTLRREAQSNKRTNIQICPKRRLLKFKRGVQQDRIRRQLSSKPLGKVGCTRRGIAVTSLRHAAVVAVDVLVAMMADNVVFTYSWKAVEASGKHSLVERAIAPVEIADLDPGGELVEGNQRNDHVAWSVDVEIGEWLEFGDRVGHACYDCSDNADSWLSNEWMVYQR